MSSDSHGGHEVETTNLSSECRKAPPTASTDVGITPPRSARTALECERSALQSRDSRFSSGFEDEFRSTYTSFSSSQGPSPRRSPRRDSRVHHNLHTARELRKAVENQFKARPKGPSSDWAGTGVAEKLKKRIATSEGLVQLLNQRIEGTEALIRKVNQVLVVLSKQRELLEGPIRTCNTRLRIRKDRPPDEQVQDDFQDALDNEKSVLDSGSRWLGEYIKAGKALLEALEAAKAAMIEDVQFKKHALRLERSALQFDPYHGRDRACVLPLVSEGSKQQVASDDGRQGRHMDVPEFKFGATHRDGTEEGEKKKEENVMRSASHTNELVDRTKALEEKFVRFRVEADDLIHKVKQNVQLAAEWSEHSMRRNIAHLFKHKKQLEQEVSSSQGDILRTEALLEGMTEEIKNQEESIARWDICPDIPLDQFDQRLPKSVQQDMRSTAMGKMQEQAQFAKRNAHLLAARCDETKDLLFQLRKSHTELEHTLETKTEAWNLDMRCAKVTMSSDKATATSQQSGMTSPRSPCAAQQDGCLLPLVQPLSKAVVDKIRSKIKSAAYTGPNGKGFDEIFSRMDKDGSGALEPEEVKRALRCSLRIPKSVVSDQEVYSLCTLLDADNSGSISIPELVAFCGGESLTGRRGVLKEKLMKDLGVEKVGGAAFELDCLANSRSRLTNSTSSVQMSSRRHGSKKGPPLPEHVIEKLRARIKAASYAGHLGREVEAMFGRFDTDGSGLLEAEEVRMALRRALRIPPSVISDDQIAKLCAMLDADDSGAISVAEIVEFVGKDAEVSKRTGRKSIVAVQSEKLAAEALREAAALEAAEAAGAA
eukprot:gb/GFBE01010390.1/.p1 GENE.gb/GFBE01010390.1/~~gb/GFBE01010390.1/.p1  ORF type:complete len:825 (+),score=199.87 gb/GFBE01010390.1/:1-2475(+)